MLKSSSEPTGLVRRDAVGLPSWKKGTLDQLLFVSFSCPKQKVALTERNCWEWLHQQRHTSLYRPSDDSPQSCRPVRSHGGWLLSDPYSESCSNNLLLPPHQSQARSFNRVTLCASAVFFPVTAEVMTIRCVSWCHCTNCSLLWHFFTIAFDFILDHKTAPLLQHLHGNMDSCDSVSGAGGRMQLPGQWRREKLTDGEL